jgi:HYR domain-containing protein
MMRDRRCPSWPHAARRRNAGPVWALLAALLALGIVAPAQATTYFEINTDTTIDSSATSLNYDVVIVTSGTVTIKAGGSISGNVDVHGTSTINLEGGSISGSVSVDNLGIINVEGGSIGGGLAAEAGSTVNVSSGSIGSLLYAWNSSTVNVSGGSIGGGLAADERGTMNISGGSFRSLYAALDSKIIVSGSCLSLTGGVLTGTLKDGTKLNNVPATTDGRAKIVLDTAPLTLALTCAPGKIVAADPGQCSARVPVDTPSTNGCGTLTVTGSRLDGQALADPYPVGSTMIAWTATDGNGNQATCSQTVTVTATYAWSGVLPPINADGSSVFKVGSTVPVKFTLPSSACASTSNVVATLSWKPVSSAAAGAANAAVSTSAATSGNQFRYDPTSGQYVFNWSTKGLAPGAYLLQINLGDGVMHTVSVGLK